VTQPIIPGDPRWDVELDDLSYELWQEWINMIVGNAVFAERPYEILPCATAIRALKEKA
jgi:hypothetical protein